VTTLQDRQITKGIQTVLPPSSHIRDRSFPLFVHPRLLWFRRWLAVPVSASNITQVDWVDWAVCSYHYYHLWVSVMIPPLTCWASPFLRVYWHLLCVGSFSSLYRYRTSARRVHVIVRNRDAWRLRQGIYCARLAAPHRSHGWVLFAFGSLIFHLLAVQYLPGFRPVTREQCCNAPKWSGKFTLAIIWSFANFGRRICRLVLFRLFWTFVIVSSSFSLLYTDSKQGHMVYQLWHSYLSIQALPWTS
jgi:hypothetical protein